MPCKIYAGRSDRAQSFVLRSYNVRELRNQNVFVSSSSSSKQLLYFVHSQGQKREQKHITKNFVEFNSQSPLINIVKNILCNKKNQFSYVI